MILLLFLLGSFWLVCLHHFVFIALGKSHEETGYQGLLKCVSSSQAGLEIRKTWRLYIPWV